MPSTPAIVVRRQDFQESSRLVTLVTRDFGRRTFLAKGAHRPRSPFAGAIDLLHVVEAKVRVREGRGIQNLDGCRVIRGNRPFRTDSLRRQLALHVVDTVRLAMPEGRPDSELFDVLHGALILFGVAPREALGNVVTGVKLRILDALGLLPEPRICPRSGHELAERGAVGFAPGKGGFVALSEGGRRVPAALPHEAARLLALDGKTLGHQTEPSPLLNQLHTLVTELLQWHLADAPRIAPPAGLFATRRATQHT